MFLIFAVKHPSTTFATSKLSKEIYPIQDYGTKFLESKCIPLEHLCTGKKPLYHHNVTYEFTYKYWNFNPKRAVELNWHCEWMIPKSLLRTICPLTNRWISIAAFLWQRKTFQHFMHRQALWIFITASLLAKISLLENQPRQWLWIV